MSDPLPSFRYLVTLDRADPYLPADQLDLIPEMAEAGFQEVTGLGAELEVMSYAEGGQNGFAHQLPVRHTWSRIVLKRGVVYDQRLWQWYQAGLSYSLGARRDGSVILLTPDGQDAYIWNFRGGLAAKWNGPDLNAMQGAVAIESLEIAHQGIEQVRALTGPLT